MSDITTAALITTVPTCVVLFLKWKADNKRSKRHENWLKTNVGEAIGQGTLVQMAEGSLRWQGEHEARDRRVFQYLGVPDDLID